MFFNAKKNSLRKSMRQIRKQEKSILIESFLQVINIRTMWKKCLEKTLTWAFFFFFFGCLNNVFVVSSRSESAVFDH